MLLSLNWLGRYVELGDLEPERVAEDLTRRTAEIEAVHRWGDRLGEVVVGEVVECGRHPGADKLSLCRVDFGAGEAVPVVCGAPNVAQGQRVAYIGVGRRLPDGTRIDEARIRGERSMGMICSERELGLGEDHEGILVLPPDAAPGRPLVEVVPCRDVLFEIDNKSITHRPDLWGHYGFARELAARYGRPLGDPLEDLDPRIPGAGDELHVRIADAQGACTRYVGLVVRDVAVGPAPCWMRMLLLAVGQRPLNNVVDLTNFLLLDLGQPMHAFDLARLRGRKGSREPEIEVRRAKAGERITTLDGVERPLDEADLLICDAQGPVALAGVMGGEGSMVGEGTGAVFLESACFDATTIRRTSTRLGLRSESSARFEKSLDPALCELAARKFAALLPEVVPGARPTGPLTDPAAWAYHPRRIGLRPERAGRLLGVAVDEAAVRGHLEPLGFAVEAGGAGALEVTVPSWRATKDVTIEEDLVEELGRCHGYDNIPPAAPLQPVQVPYRDPELELVARIARVAAHDCDYFEALHYSFLSDELCDRMGLGDAPYVRVTNSIASNLSRVRRDVLPGLIGSLEENLRREERVRLFELGKGYHPEVRGEVRELGGVERSLPFEVHQCGAVLADRRNKGPHPYAEARGHLEHLLRCVGRPSLEPIRHEAPPSWMHPGRTAAFVAPEDHGKVVAYVGELHPRLVEALGLPLPTHGGGVACWCLDIRALLAVAPQEVRYRPVPRFPDQPVDLAILAPRAVEVLGLERVLADAAPDLVREVRLFEVYRGDGLPEGRKSLNFTVVLGSDERTLTADDEVRYIAAVRALLPARDCELRG
ncbi:MAG: phenylalanine--tRNA ligase subunit beta [Planctomycetota bacterium]